MLKKAIINSMRKIASYLHKADKYVRDNKGTAILTLLMFIFLVGIYTYGIHKYNSRNNLVKDESIESAVRIGDSMQTKKKSSPVQEKSEEQAPPDTSGSNGETTSSRYTKSVCTDKVVPYDTIYEPDPLRYVGSSYVIGGYNGKIRTCTKDSDGYKDLEYNVKPTSKTVYYGTRPIEGGDTDREEKIAACVRYMNSVAPGSSAYKQCYTIY